MVEVVASTVRAGKLRVTLTKLSPTPLPPVPDLSVGCQAGAIQLLAEGRVVCALQPAPSLGKTAKLQRAVARLAWGGQLQLNVASVDAAADQPGFDASVINVTLDVTLAPSFFEIEEGDEVAPCSALVLQYLLSTAAEAEEAHEDDQAAAQGGRGSSQPMDIMTAGEEGQDLRDRVFGMVLPSDWQLEHADPPGLLCSLFRYQRRELAWAVWRESLRDGRTPCGVNDPDSVKAQLLTSDFLWHPTRLPAGPTLYIKGGLARLQPVRPPQPEVVGGILADEMGLGKTVCAIALCLASPPPKPALPAAAAAGSMPVGAGVGVDSVAQPSAAALVLGTAPGSSSVRAGGTLVICPPALLQQWRAEIGNHAAGSLTVCEYEGLRGLGELEELKKKKVKPAQREMELYARLLAGEELVTTYDAEAQAAAAVEELVAADIVVTTFDVLRAEVHYKPSTGLNLRHAKRYAVTTCPLLQVSWWRVVVDEAQMVGSFSSAGVMVHRLQARSTWALTGTPIRGNTLQQELDSLQSLLSLVQHPLGDPGAWKRLVATPLLVGSRDQQRDAWRLLQHTLQPVMWRNTKAAAAEEHELPRRSLKVTRLAFQAGEAEFYAQAVERTKEARRALLDFRQDAKEAEAAAAAAAAPTVGIDEAGTSSPSPGRRLNQARKRKQRSSERLEDAALESLTQMRLACIHPQLTKLWAEMSGDLQLNIGGTLAMDEVLGRLADKVSFELQDAERSLCANLNSLAMVLLGRGRVEAAAPGNTDGGKANEKVAAQADLPCSPEPPAKKARRSSKAGQAAVNNETLAEAKELLEQSFRVAEKGIDAKDVSMADLVKLEDQEAASTSTVTGVYFHDDSLSTFLPYPLRPAWKKLQLNTAHQLAWVYHAVGQDADAARMEEDAREKSHYLRSQIEMHLVQAQQRVEQLQQQVDATRQVFQSTLAAALAAGFPPWGITPSAASWLDTLQRVYQASREEEQLELQAQKGVVRAMLGKAVRTRLADVEKAVQQELNAVEGFVSLHHIGNAIRKLERMIAHVPDADQDALREDSLEMGRIIELLPSFKRDTVYSQFYFLLPKPAVRSRGMLVKPGNEASTGQGEPNGQLVQQQWQKQQHQHEYQQDQQEELQEQNHQQRQMTDAVSCEPPSGQASASAAFTAAADANALAAVQEAATKGPGFIAADRWLGAVEGYVFKLGTDNQLGYFQDHPPQAPPLHSPEVVNRLAAVVQRHLHSERRKLQQAAGAEVAVLSACPFETVESKLESCRMQLELVRLQLRLHEAAANLALQQSLQEDLEQEVRQAAEERPMRLSASALRKNIDAFTRQATELRGKRMYMRNRAQEARGTARSEGQQQEQEQREQQQSDGRGVPTDPVAAGPSQSQPVECPVCLTSISDDINVFSVCGHAFCGDCTAKLVLQSGTCAVCRTKVTAKQVFRVAANRSSSRAELAAPALDPDAAQFQDINVVGEWSIKILALMRRILYLAATAPQEKVLVFSKFPDALKLVSLALQTNRIRFVQLVGGKLAARKALKQFVEDEGTRVFLLSHKAGAAGLTLTRANHVLLLEPSLDVSIEQQAIARVHRIGQVRPVYIERLLVRSSVEELVVMTAERKAVLLSEAEETLVASVDHQAGSEAKAEMEDLLNAL